MSSDHEVIGFQLAGLGDVINRMGTSQEIMEWSIKGMSEEVRKEPQENWHQVAAGRRRMRERCSKNDIEDMVTWIKSTLTRTLDMQGTQKRVIA